MTLPLYQIDAFTSVPFGGNPAAVVPLEDWLDDNTLQNIALENNLSETAFFVPASDGDGYELRWFTPTVEVELCGHATLASAFVIFEILGWDNPAIPFQTRKSGTLTVTRVDDRMEMDFPATAVKPMDAPDGLADALGLAPVHVMDAGYDILAVFEREQQVRELEPDLSALARYERRGIIPTAPGDAVDFVSRFFAPRYGVPEDPVTGSAHCSLVPYWSERLNKLELHARQISKRGGELWCRNAGDRVIIGGQAVLYLEGTIRVPAKP